MRGLVRALRPLGRLAAPVLRPLGRLARLLPHARAASVLTAPWRVVTPTGVAAGVLLAACVAAGWVLGWQEAWSAAVVLAVVVCTAWLWLLPSGGHQVSHSPLNSKVTVGDHALVHVEVTNPLTRSLLPTRMELPIGGGTAVFAVPTLAPRASFERGFVLPTDHRGVVTVGPVLCVARDPVGLLRRERERTRAQRIHVHPRTVLMGAVLQGVLRDVEGAVTQDLSSSDVSFHALRDYVPGDDRRNVHWRTTARVGRLMVRQFEETRRAHLLLVLDLDPASWAGDEDFETAVSVTASLALTALREHRELSLVTQAGVPLLPTSTRVLDLLTTIERLADRGDLMEVTRCAAAAVPDASVTVLVTGSLVPIASIHRAHVELPLSTRSIALRVDGDAALRSQRLAGLPVLTLPELDLLGRAMRKVDS